MDVSASPLSASPSLSEAKEGRDEFSLPGRESKRSARATPTGLSPCTSPMSESSGSVAAYKFPTTTRNRGAAHKGFDFDPPVAPLSSLTVRVAESKAEGKDAEEGEGGSEDKDDFAIEEQLERTPRARRLSGMFSVTGPIDDDDTCSVASSNTHYSAKDYEGGQEGGASPPAPRRVHSRSFHLQLSSGLISKSGSQSSTSNNGPLLFNSQFSIDAEDSPRIPLPPHLAGDRPLSYRPQSAEKSRWLARVSLLRGGRENSGVARLAQQDEDAVRLGWGKEKYVHLEYLEWMGNEALQGTKNRGPLQCPGCSNVIGSYDWHPHER